MFARNQRSSLVSGSIGPTLQQSAGPLAQARWFYGDVHDDPSLSGMPSDEWGTTKSGFNAFPAPAT